MAETVKVSLLHPMAYRASKSEPFTRYKPGIVEMPIEHARGLGLTHRIVREVATTDEGATVVDRAPFNGAFDEKLANILTGAGYNTIEDLGKASQDALMSVDGIGPANYERIQRAVKGA
jgi:hypothetical protein